MDFKMTILPCSLMFLQGLLLAQERNVVRIFDVSDIVWTQEGKSVQAGPVFENPENEFFFWKEAEACPPFDMKGLVSYLEGNIGNENIDIEKTDCSLVVTGKPEVVETVSRLLGTLKNIFGLRIGIEAYLFESEGGDFNLNGGVLSKEETEKLVGLLYSGGPFKVISRATFQVPLGGYKVWERVKMIPIINYYEAELASKTAITSPKRNFARAGCKLRVSAVPLASDKVALFVDTFRASGFHKRQITLGLERVKMIEAGDVMTVSLTGSGALGPGEALLIGDVSGEKGSFFLVKAEFVPIEERNIVYCGPLFLDLHLGLGLPLPPELAEMEKNRWDYSEEVSNNPIPGIDTLKLAANTMDLDMREITKLGIIIKGGKWREDTWERIRAGLGIPAAYRNHKVEVVVKGMDAGDAGSSNPKEIFSRGRMMKRIIVPVLQGRQGSIVSGRECQFLRDYSSEVAEKASQNLPSLGCAWSGITGRLILAGNTVELEMMDQWCSAPEIQYLGSKDMGPVEKVEGSAATISYHGRIDGKFHVIGCGVERTIDGVHFKTAVGLLIE